MPKISEILANLSLVRTVWFYPNVVGRLCCRASVWVGPVFVKFSRSSSSPVLDLYFSGPVQDQPVWCVDPWEFFKSLNVLITQCFDVLSYVPQWLKIIFPVKWLMTIDDWVIWDLNGRVETETRTWKSSFWIFVRLRC